MSAIEPSDLALFWAGVIVVAILVYVILDGFDLGIGILFGTTRDPVLREEMMAAISPFWDGGGFGKAFQLGGQPMKLDLDAYYNAIRPKAGNETWLLQATVTFQFPD